MTRPNRFNVQVVTNPSHSDGIHEVEKSILHSIISYEISPISVVESLGVDDFNSETHCCIFRAIEKLHTRGEPIDALAVHGELEIYHRPDGGDWGSYIISVLPTSLPIVESNLGFYIEKIKQASCLRKISELSCRIHEAASRGELETVESLIDNLNESQRNSVTCNRLNPISAKDLPNISPPESLWGGFLYPGCITQLNAEPGAGKSTLLYNIAALGALGKDFLRIPFSKKIKTLFVDLESPQWLQKQKIEMICGELPTNLHLLSEFSLKRDLNELVRLVKEEQYDLIVFDTQTKALDMEDENDNAEANRVATILKKLAMETRAAILLIHHNKKGEGGKDVYRGRGASAIAAAVDIVAILNSQSYSILKLEIVKSRVPGVYQTITMKKVGDDKFERVGTDEVPQGYKSRRVQEFILTLLGDYEEWQTAQILEQAEKEDFKARTVESELRRLVEQGKVIKPRHGIYKLAANPEEKSLNGGIEDRGEGTFELS